VSRASTSTEVPHRKLDALKIAKAAAEDYRFLTGKPPTRSENKGRFPGFLAAIFTALGIPDSVDNWARQACEWWEGDRVRENQADIEKLLLQPPPRNLDDGAVALPQSWWQLLPCSPVGFGGISRRRRSYFSSINLCRSIGIATI
jgi:hypothetical protein